MTYLSLQHAGETLSLLTQDAVEHAVTELLSTLQSCDFSRLTRSVLNEPRLRFTRSELKESEDLDGKHDVGAWDF